jgi:Leucine-rich repeat (LRR) protein
MDNNITYVHPMIDMLQNLTFLMLSGNPGLSTLPNEISNLTNLNVFFLDGTNL